MNPLILEVENQRPIECPTWTRVERIFDKWDTLSRGYFILREGSRSYVQTAGASYKALVEYRQVHPDGTFAHYVLGHPGGDPTPTAIYSSRGTLHLRQNEIFKLPEILEIFRTFYDERTVPAHVALRNITADFTGGRP